MCTLANSEDPDKMPRFILGISLGSTRFAKKKVSSKKQTQIYLESIICDPSTYTIHHTCYFIKPEHEKEGFITAYRADWHQFFHQCVISFTCS